MTVALIVAMDRAGLIGTDAGLPWHLPADLKRFRALTWGKPIVMGRKTLDSIGRPLPGRHNIVLTTQPDFSFAGITVVHTVDDALREAKRWAEEHGQDEITVIGGAMVYAQLADRTGRIYLTLVEGSFQGSVYFPRDRFDAAQWTLTREEYFPADAKNPHAHRLLVFERNDTPGEARPDWPFAT